MTAIKPCPFCGDVGITFSEGSTFRWYLASCNSCGASCGEIRTQTMGDGTQARWKAQAELDATAEWNTRAELVGSGPRTWVGLTDMERYAITSLKWWDWEDAFDIDGFTRAIETKLKEKNT